MKVSQLIQKLQELRARQLAMGEDFEVLCSGFDEGVELQREPNPRMEFNKCTIETQILL